MLDETGFPMSRLDTHLVIRKLRYSINSQLPMAHHIMGFLAFSRGDALTSDVLAVTYGTSPVVLRRVLAKLKRAGLMQPRRGTGGDSVLAWPVDSVTLREVCEAMTKDTKLMTPFSKGCSGPVAPILGCYVNELFADAEQALLAKLQAVTVAEMDRDVSRRILKAMDPKRKARADSITPF